MKYLVEKYGKGEGHRSYNSSFSYGSSSSSSSSSGPSRMATDLTAEEVRLCLYSLSDNQSFLNTNKRPIEECQALLERYFCEADGADPASSLAIDDGRDGARLSHSHAVQYHYVRQSLALWTAVIDDMFRLWALAELDLLREDGRYDLRHTGQGLQRVQPSPRVYQAMHQILARAKLQLGGWVGSSVIHLGDNNVPNALIFIDKYMQVSQILGPLVSTLRNIELACTSGEGADGLMAYMESWGGVDAAKKAILRDFFTHGFDGSGGDNFFDAGSCIDGRLTSAWNWCSRIADKPYYPLFRLTGFLSFDVSFPAASCMLPTFCLPCFLRASLPLVLLTPTPLFPVDKSQGEFDK